MEAARASMEAAQDLATSHPYLTGLAAVATACVVHRLVFRKKKPHMVDAPPNTVVLYQLPRGPYAPSLSPFPLKLETYLRIAGIPYQNVFGFDMSPKGKTPWISYNNEPMADSQFIIEFLNKKFGADLNTSLSEQEKSVAHAFRVMVDEHLYWCVAYLRWIPGMNQKNLAMSIPWIIRRHISHGLRKQVEGQGIGRHTQEEIKAIMLQDLQALSDQLGGKPFMMGDSPTELDCSAFGMLSQLVYHASDDVCEGLVQERFPSLHQFCERMKARVWPDWEECNTSGETKEATK